ncbi:MAG: RNA recognition motif domain-containing protein [Acidobacteriota bacterium]
MTHHGQIGRAAIATKLFVGNLNYNTRKEELSELFGAAGQVVDVFIPTDRATGRARGFAFVEFASEAEAEEAIRQFNGREFGGRPLKVNAAESRPPRVGAPRPSAPYAGFSQPEPAFDSYSGFGGDARPARPKGSRRNLRARRRSL